MRRALALLALAAALGCGTVERFPPPYAAWEGGLVLQYEDPRIQDPVARRDARLQLRVARSSVLPTGERLVALTVTSQHGEGQVSLQIRQKGVFLVGDRGTLAPMLPEGFPKVERWSDGEERSRILGRGAWLDPSVRLDDPSHEVGWWVETVRPGLVKRTLYLPNVGEAETWHQVDGRWICVNRLVGRGFVDELPGSGA